MLNLDRSSNADRRPYLGLAPWETGFRAWDPEDPVTGEVWHPTGAQAVTLSADEAEQMALDLIAALKDRRLSGLLLIGRTRQSGSVRLQTRALNRRPGASDRHDPTAAGIVRATLPMAEILRDLNEAGLDGQVYSEAEDDLGSYLLYRILADLPDDLNAPPVGLLRLPRDMAPERVQLAIRTSASAIARHLPTLVVPA